MISSCSNRSGDMVGRSALDCVDTAADRLLREGYNERCSDLLRCRYAEEGGARFCEVWKLCRALIWTCDAINFDGR